MVAIFALIALVEYACHALPDNGSNGTLGKFYSQGAKREIVTATVAYVSLRQISPLSPSFIRRLKYIIDNSWEIALVSQMDLRL